MHGLYVYMDYSVCMDYNVYLVVWLLAEWSFYLSTGNVNFITLRCAITSICTLPIYYAPFSFPIFVNT